MLLWREDVDEVLTRAVNVVKAALLGGEDEEEARFSKETKTNYII